MTVKDLEANPGAAQAAIDAAGAGGGGEVVLPAGCWAPGDLFLRTGVCLRLAVGCTLAGCIRAEHVEDVAVLGEGAGRVRGTPAARSRVRMDGEAGARAGGEAGSP